MTTKKPAPFEQNLTALEGIVEQLESGELSLDDSLKAFEQGIALTRSCQSALADAEQKVHVLMTKNGEEQLDSLPTRESE